jgi:hypothetical protein
MSKKKINQTVIDDINKLVRILNIKLGSTLNSIPKNEKNIHGLMPSISNISSSWLKSINVQPNETNKHYFSLINGIIGQSMEAMYSNQLVELVRKTIDKHNKSVVLSNITPEKFKANLELIKHEANNIPGLNLSFTPLNSIPYDKSNDIKLVFIQEWVFGSALFVWEFFILTLAKCYYENSVSLSPKELPQIYELCFNT